MNTLKFDVYKNTLKRRDGFNPVIGEKNYTKIKCYFTDDDWDNCTAVTANFMIDKDNVIKSSVSLTAEDKTVVFDIPSDLDGNTIFFSLTGSYSEKNITITLNTNIIGINRIKGMLPSEKVDISLYETIISLYNKINTIVSNLKTQKLDNSLGSVSTNNLQDNSVTLEKIATESVNTKKLCTGAVTAEKLGEDVKANINKKANKGTTLASYGITDTYTGEIIDNLLGKKLIAMPFDDVPKQSSPCYLNSGAVYAALIAKANASDVYSKDVANKTFIMNNSGAITTALIADGAVTTAKLENGSITTEKLETACVGFDELATNSVSTGHICDGAVTVEKLGEDATTAINSKADKATTLAGYGITDTYTKEIIDNKLGKKLVAMPFDSEPKIKSPCYITSGAVYAALIAKANASDVYSKDVANKTFIMNNSGVITTALIANGAVTAEKLGEDVAAAINDKAGQSKVSQIDSRLQSVELDIKNKVNNSTFSVAIAQKYDSSNVETGSGNLTPAQESYEGCEGSFSYSKVGSTVTVSLKITALLTGKNYVQLAGLPYRAITASKLSSMAAYTTNNKLVNLRIDGAWLYIFYPVGTFADGEKINATIAYITN